VTVRITQIETNVILNESRHHFEGIRGESHPANCSDVFENILFSLMRVRWTAKVAGFWGLAKITSGFAVALLNLGSSAPANVLLAQHSR
jgi:hypothetical protein